MNGSDFDFTPEAIKRRYPSLGSKNLCVDDATREKEAERSRRQKLLGDFLRSIGCRYSNCTLDSFSVTMEEQHNVVDALKTYLTNIDKHLESGDGIVLFGPSGTGKDHLLVSLARVAIRTRGLRVEWQNGAELFASLRSRIGTTSKENEMIMPLVRADILILSDPTPPGGALTEYQSSTLYRLVDARYRASRPTWVSINVRSGSEADQRLGVATADRLRDGSVCLFTSWPSYRRPQ